MRFHMCVNNFKCTMAFCNAARMYEQYTLPHDDANALLYPGYDRHQSLLYIMVFDSEQDAVLFKLTYM